MKTHRLISNINGLHTIDIIDRPTQRTLCLNISGPKNMQAKQQISPIYIFLEKTTVLQPWCEYVYIIDMYKDEVQFIFRNTITELIHNMLPKK